MSRFRGKGSSQSNESNAESDLGVDLQQLKNEGKIDDIGISNEWIGLTKPDRQWPRKKVAFFLDGDEVHEEGDEWDSLVDRVLEFMGWTVLRERYHAPLSKMRRHEILAKILTLLEALKS